MIIEMWRVFVSKTDQNVHSSTEFNFEKCYRLASCELRRRDQGRSHIKLMASGTRSSDYPMGVHISVECMILQVSDCTQDFVILVSESSLDTITNQLQISAWNHRNFPLQLQP